MTDGKRENRNQGSVKKRVPIYFKRGLDLRKRRTRSDCNGAGASEDPGHGTEGQKILWADTVF